MSSNTLTGPSISSYKKRYFVLTFLFCIVIHFIAVIPYCYGVSDDTSFDFDSIQAKIKNITLEIKRASLTRQEIEKASDQTKDFHKNATECIDTSTTQVSNLDEEILSLGPVLEHEPADTAKKRKKLTREKQSLQVKISECRLIATLALQLKNELADWDKIQKQDDFFTKTDNFYNKFWAALPSFDQFKSSVIVYGSTRSGFQDVSYLEILVLILLSASGGICGWKFFKLLQHQLLPLQRIRPSQQVVPLKGGSEMIGAFAALTGWGYSVYASRGSITETYGSWVFLSVALYCCILSLFHFYIFLYKTGWMKDFGVLPLRRIRLLVILCVLLFFSTRLDLTGFSELNAPYALAQSVIICAICFAGWRVLCSLELLTGFIRWQKTLRTIISIYFILVLITEVSGYRNVSIFLLIGLFATYLLSVLLRITLLAVNEIIGGFFLGKYRWQQHIRQALGISAEESLMGILWLGFIFKLLAWFTAFFLLLQTWGLSSQQRKEIGSYLVNGLHIGSLIVAPGRILVGIFVFACGWTLVSWIKLQLEKKWLQHSHVSRSAQETLVTATGYAGFVLALVIGLSIAGVSFSNLAVIAGALSVGIGFGLQNIVNNFVSGLIILFERPVKRGDWIRVGNTEGYVQKISVRSTLIQTFDRSDVIVPNSELISNQVTNMMLNDRYGRLVVPIGVAYGSDTELVRTILLDIARSNNKVINDKRAPLPHVLFLEFGDSSLNFELRCHLSNIDERLIVKSEINYEIDRQFRKHNVSIPFPQRDLYIKDMPSGRQTEADT